MENQEIISNKFEVFSNEKFGKVRVIVRDGESWFVGKDVAEILGYSNTRDALSRHVDFEDKNTVVNPDGNKGNPNMVIINESGLYSLILSSKLPTAKKFKHWVTNEVLPAIRKHGGYLTPKAIEATLTNPDFIIQLATKLKSEQEARKIAEAKLIEAEPKINFADSVQKSTKTILVGELAKLLKQNGVDIGQNRLFELLRRDGYLMRKNGEKNYPSQYSMNKELMEVEERTGIRNGLFWHKFTPKITGKGQIYFLNKYRKLA